MGELESIANGQPERLAPVVAVGGVLTIKQVLGLYAPILGESTDTLPASDRFLPIPRQNLGEPDDMLDIYEEKLVNIYEKLGGPMVVVGHSLGGLVAEMAGLRHPDKVAAVVMLAGAQEGIARHTPSSYALVRALNRPETRHINRRSDFMQGHRENVSKLWSPAVGHYAISPMVDDLILPPQGLRAKLPEGQTAHRYVAAPDSRAARFLLRMVPGMPSDVEILPSRPTTHYDLPLAPAVVKHVTEIRRVAATGDELATVRTHRRLYDGSRSRRVAHELRAGWDISDPAAA
ncbi:MAG TPA: alpha/beta hydrolase [Candidatus Saccharimonadales bacterium]|nr:alpha/beta hydrolase [Candidatus Saccharimonadales bacterium]